MRKIIIIILINIFSVAFSFGQNYNASFFGCVSDGITNNTASIQAGIDFIASKGGGKLDFYVGRYLTGGIDLKSNVTIELHEGAVLVATPNVNDFSLKGNYRALIFGENISNAKIIGKGVIEANPDQYYTLVNELRAKKMLASNYLDVAPSLITLVNCKNVEIKGIILQQSVKNALDCIKCQEVLLQDLIVRSNGSKEGAGIYLQKSTGITLLNLFVSPKSRALVKDSESKIKLVKNCISTDGKSIL